MEVDDVVNDFGCLQTCDHDDLVSQMLRLTGSGVTLATARFYLEANQWSVGAAVCSYFEHLASDSPLPTMTLIKDLTLGEGESVPPSTKFLKTWLVSNPGPAAWPPGCLLRFTGGASLANTDRVLLPWEPLEPGNSAELSLQMESPSSPGIYQSTWRMSTATGNYFGEAIWVIVTVDVAGTLAITQQLAQINNLGSRSTNNCDFNPFNSAGDNLQSKVDEISGMVTKVEME